MNWMAFLYGFAKVYRFETDRKAMQKEISLYFLFLL